MFLLSITMRNLFRSQGLILALILVSRWNMVGPLLAQESSENESTPKSVNPLDPQSAANQLVNLKAIEKQLREKLVQTNNDPYVLHKLGSILYRQGKVLEARETWDQAANQDPNVADSDVSVAIELIAKGDIKSAAQALKTAEMKNPENPHLYLARGDLLFRQQKFEAAEAQFNKALELNPKLLVTHIWLGRYYQMRNNIPAALKSYTKATEVVPHRAEAWVMLSAIQFRMFDTAAAHNSLKEAEKHDPDHQLAEIRLANFHLANNDFLGGMKYLKQAAIREPDNILTHLALAEVLMRLNQNEEARPHLEQALTAEDNIKAVVTLAELERREGNYDKAEAIYRRGLKNQPDHVILNNNLAMTLMCAKPHHEEVLALAEIAIRGAAQNPAIQGTYACALLEAGKTEEAMKSITPLVRQLPTDPWIRYTYGKLLLGQNRKEDAREQLEGCLILDPKFPRKAEIEEVLLTLK
ncbi:MAG: tetratricopeptide repeat protein [Planctomycetaceae bacterium]